MAENKKAVLVYTDWINKFEALTDEEAGKLIKHFFRYINDEEPEAQDRTTELMFIDIKNTLKRDLNKYKGTKIERSNSGKLGNLKKYQNDLYDKVISNSMTLDEAITIANTRKSSHSDKNTRIATENVAKLAVSVSVSDSVSDKEKKEIYSFDEFWNDYPVKIGKKDCSKKWIKLKEEDKQIIKDTIKTFTNYKPFKDYSHPNPQTYINQERWNDEIIDNTKVDNGLSQTFNLTEYLIPRDDSFGLSNEVLTNRCKEGFYKKAY